MTMAFSGMDKDERQAYDHGILRDGQG